MNLSSAYECHDLIANLLQLEGSLDNREVVFRHLDYVVVAEKVRRM